MAQAGPLGLLRWTVVFRMHAAYDEESGGWGTGKRFTHTWWTYHSHRHQAPALTLSESLSLMEGVRMSRGRSHMRHPSDSKT